MVAPKGTSMQTPLARLTARPFTGFSGEIQRTNTTRSGCLTVGIDCTIPAFAACRTLR
jgi:hypothetical protein